MLIYKQNKQMSYFFIYSIGVYSLHFICVKQSEIGPLRVLEFLDPFYISGLQLSEMNMLQEW
jgi:hypothetical protein